MNKTLASLTILCIAIFSCGTDAQDETRTVNFVNDIKPILESNCFSCHNEENAEGGYRIDVRDDALEYVEAGDAESSDFYDYLITDDEDVLMPPPDEGGPLDDSDIQLIKTWINEGAEWPEGIVLQDPEAEASTATGETTEPTEDAATKREKNKVYRAIGSLHPAAVHLPVGLLLAAGLFAFLSLRGNFVMSDCAYYCLWLGTLGAVAACLTGWWFTLSEYPNEVVNSLEDLTNQGHKVFWHRISAIVATLFALMLALFASSARNRDPDDGMGWKLGAILLAVGIGLVGHQGGELTWKPSHYKELKEVVGEYIPGIVDEQENGGAADEDEDDGDQPDDAAEDGGSGETSGEVEL